MPIVAESKCPHCKKRIIVETIKSKVWPLGIAKVHKPKDYNKLIPKR